MEELEMLEEFMKFAMLGDEYMTKTKYENALRELEEKEGKCFTIREIAEILGISIETVKFYYLTNSVRSFKLRHYRTQNNITLIPQDEVLKAAVNRTNVLPVLKTLTELSEYQGKTLEEIIELLEEHRKE